MPSLLLRITPKKQTCGVGEKWGYCLLPGCKHAHKGIYQEGICSEDNKRTSSLPFPKAGEVSK